MGTMTKIKSGNYYASWRMEGSDSNGTVHRRCNATPQTTSKHGDHQRKSISRDSLPLYHKHPKSRSIYDRIRFELLLISYRAGADYPRFVYEHGSVTDWIKFVLFDPLPRATTILVAMLVLLVLYTTDRGPIHVLRTIFLLHCFVSWSHYFFMTIGWLSTNSTSNSNQRGGRMALESLGVSFMFFPICIVQFWHDRFFQFTKRLLASSGDCPPGECWIGERRNNFRVWKQWQNVHQPSIAWIGLVLFFVEYYCFYGLPDVWLYVGLFVVGTCHMMWYENVAMTGKTSI